jgi:hypothetical protein
MGLATATGPPPTGVQRLFEPNRLAKDYEASAYEEALPVVCRVTGRAAAPVSIPVTAVPTASSHQGGRAA